MINIIRTTPFPKCKYCGKQLEFYIFGMDDKDHSHDQCWIEHKVNKSINKVLNK